MSKIIVGIDEVGRGCWAGPLVAAAVVLGEPIEGLGDSKKIPKAKRKVLSDLIHKNAISVGIGWTDVISINEHGLTYAVSNAMREALSKVKTPYDEVIIDGDFNYLPEIDNVKTVVRADDTVPEASAASIVAKVYRDEWMADLSKKYPEYGFDKHVGYGTKQHMEMLEIYGPCDIHRINYKPIQKLLLRRQASRLS